MAGFNDFSLDAMMRQAASQYDLSRVEIMRKAILAYNDNSTKPLKVDATTGIDDNVQINYSRTIVEKGVAFLFGETLKIEITKPKRKGQAGAVETDDENPAEDYLDDVWPEDIRGEDFIDLATNGGQTGHVWAQIVIENGRPRVVVQDPLNLSAVWDERDIRRVEKYTAQWPSFDEHNRSIVRRQTVTRQGATWLIEDFYSYSDGSTWHRDGDAVVWRYEFAPVFQVKNLPNANVFYGSADLNLCVLRLNHYINRVDSLINKIIRIHAHPKTVAYGITEDQLEISSDGILFVDEFEAELKNLEMQSDLTAAQTFRDKMRGALAEVSHVPEITTGKTDNLGTLSGRAMAILYGPLIDQTKKKRLLYGRFIKDIVRALLVIGGHAVASKEIVLRWGAMLPADDKEAAETALIKKQIGFSTDTLIQELGGDPDTEREKRALDINDTGAIIGAAFDGGRGSDVYGGTAGAVAPDGQGAGQGTGAQLAA